jgi:hypothetical protein
MISPPPTSVPTSIPTVDPSVVPTFNPSAVPSESPSSEPTQSPTTQLVLWKTLDDCVLTNPILNSKEFSTYDKAFYACEVVFPACIGFTLDPTTKSYTLYASNAFVYFIRCTSVCS